MAKGQIVDYNTASGIDNGWEKIWVTYTPESTGTYSVAMVIEDTTGSAYGDDFQLEEGTVPTGTNLRTPTVVGTLAAGVTSGVLAGGTKAIGSAISSGKFEIGKIKGVRASEGYPGVRYKTNAGPAYSVELHGSHNGHTPHLQVNKWLYQYKGYQGQPYRFRSWHYEFFKPWKGVY